MICLDTNAVIAAINGRIPEVRARLTAALVGGTAVGISAIALYELRYGIQRSTRPEANAAALASFLLLPVSVWPFEAEDAAEAGAVRAELERRGAPIGLYDTLIAAQARRRDATLITGNLREFRRVKGLRCESWVA